MTESAAPKRARRSRLAPALPKDFYERDTEHVARELLGAVLECRTPDGVAAGRIVETEAYVGEHDLACHAAAGRTPRTAPLYGPPGIAYVYFIYGMYWCVNAVTRAKDAPSAVLIRAVEPLIGLDLMHLRRPTARRAADLTNGPGKLCLALGITGAHNWHPLQRPPLVIRRGDSVADANVTLTPRIGVSKAADWPLRWFVTDSPFVSKTPSHFPRHAASKK
ncbi:MAG TPA: DNA-3-methyladenine glycosylase [Gemmatimonadaceae bacterium]